MNLVACPRCGAQFDVSSFSPGASFVCGACQNTLQVPAAPVVAPVVAPVMKPVARPVAKAAAPVAPAAPPAAPAPAMLQKKPAVDPRRAGGAAPAAAGPGRAERIRQQRAEGGEKAKKNPLPLVLAGVAAVALLAVGAMMVMKKEPPKEAGPEAMGPGPVGQVPLKGGTAPEVPAGETPFEKLPDSKKLEIVEQKVKEAGRGASHAKESWEWLSGKGLTADAQRALAAGRAVSPSDAWINGKLGLVNRGDDIRKTANDENLTFNVSEENPDFRKLMEMNRKLSENPAAAWVTEEESKALDVLVANLRAVVERLSDPVYARTKKEFDNVRLNPAFTDLEFSFEAYRPYVIFAELPSSEQKEKADRTVRITGKALQFVYRRWIEFMKTDLGLDAPTMEDLGDDRLKVFIFKSRESFDAWHSKNGIGNPGQSVAAYYQHGADRMIMMHIDAFDPGVIMHEGTHQLIHYYARHFCQVDDDAVAEKEGKPKETVLFDDTRLRSRMFWFQEGIAEYFGGADPVTGKDDEWVIGGLQKDRLGFFKFMQKRGSLWSLEDFLFKDQGQITSMAKVKGGGLGGDELKGLMYSQGWTLVHFLLEGGGGKYRPQMLRMMRNELSGQSGQLFVLEAFGLPKRTDDPKYKEFLAEIEVAYMKHFEDLFQRMITLGK